MKRLVTLLAISGSLLLVPAPALAKGNVSARGYAVITGPRLIHPIVLTAPWDGSKGGYYGNEAEFFLHLAGDSGAIPPARDLLAGGGSLLLDGVVPLRSAPSSASLGPVYQLTWFRDGSADVVAQKVYPYASAGPVVYTPPASRQALIALFGRFQDPAHLSTGWGTATSQDDLLAFLQARGLPGPGPGPVAEVTRPAAHASGLGIGLALAALGAALAAALAVQRRRRNTRRRAVTGE